VQAVEIEKLVGLITAEVLAALREESADVGGLVNAGASRLAYAMAGRHPWPAIWRA
jgi:hypothetical protein